MTNSAAHRYSQRGAPIIHDTIDNETIAINQLTGAYYSLEGASALAWERLAAGATTADVADAIAASFDGERGEIDRAAAAFVGELLAEDLIVEVDRVGTAEAADQPAPAATRRQFTGLRLQRYTDLEVMLLADPIHEVDETGWPKPIAQAQQ